MLCFCQFFLNTETISRSAQGQTMPRKVYPAEQPESASMNSLGDASGMLIRQFNFPNKYSELDGYIHEDSDRCSMWDFEHARDCFTRHTGTGDQGLGCWVKSATDEQVMAFLADILKKQDIKWTGYRVLGTVNRSSGYAMWTLALFRKHPDSKTRVYTGPIAPNVLPGRRR